MAAPESDGRPTRPLPHGALIDSEGVWCQIVRPACGAERRPALFLDRDGVVVEEVHYLGRPEDVRLVAGAAHVIALANRLGVPVVLVTNQAGIARSYYGWNDFMAVQERILDALAAAGAGVDAVFACPYHPDGEEPFVHPDHPARKPRPGMLIRAARALTLDLGASWIVGDRASDIEAGRNAKLAGGVHVASGHGHDKRERRGALAFADRRFRVLTAATLAGVPRLLPLLDEED